LHLKTDSSPGAWIASTNDGQGNITATQTPTSPLTGGPTATIPLDWSSGPATLSGWIDPVTLDTSIRLTVLGISLRDSFAGNLKDGINLNINIQMATGAIKLYLKNGNEIWVNLDCKVLFDGSFTGDYKIISI